MDGAIGAGCGLGVGAPNKQVSRNRHRAHHNPTAMNNTTRDFGGLYELLQEYCTLDTLYTRDDAPRESTITVSVEDDTIICS